MALRSLASLRIFFDTLPSGTKTTNPPDLTNTTPPEAETELKLANGVNTIAIPDRARGAVIIPPNNGTVIKSLRGVAGDTGLVISKDRWTVISFDFPPPANLIINATTVDPNYTRIIFF